MGDTYTHGHHASVLRSHEWRTAENSAGYLLPHLRPGLELLDVGCGPGTITVDLALRVAPGRVVGIDPAAEVVERAAANAVPALGGETEAAAVDVSFAEGTTWIGGCPPPQEAAEKAIAIERATGRWERRTDVRCIEARVSHAAGLVHRAHRYLTPPAGGRYLPSLPTCPSRAPRRDRYFWRMK